MSGGVIGVKSRGGRREREKKRTAWTEQKERVGGRCDKGKEEDEEEDRGMWEEA